MPQYKTYRAAVVCGPTASGKTETAAELALLVDGEVISADSVQVYRHLDIGSAKPSAAEMRGVPHHMIDVVSPLTDFSAGAYRGMAKACMEDIEARGRFPVICGGTGLYIDALLDPRGLTGAGRNEAFRQRMAEEAAANQEGYLWGLLNTADPARAAMLHPNDSQRIIRALEIIDQTGRPASENFSRPSGRSGDLLWIGLDCPRDILYDRIGRRTERMMEAGFAREVEGLIGMGLTPLHASMKAIGYRELLPVVRDGLPPETAVEKIKQSTRNYAKRQLTWFRRIGGITWFDLSVKRPTEIAEFCAGLLV